MFDIKPTHCFLLFFRAAIFIIGNFPIIKETTLEAFETIFATKAVARQLVLAVALETGMVRQGTASSIGIFLSSVMDHLLTLFLVSSVRSATTR
jgi:hypothetical protein